MPEGTIDGTYFRRCCRQFEELLYTIVGGDSYVRYTAISEREVVRKMIFEGENTAMMKVILSPECTLHRKR